MMKGPLCSQAWNTLRYKRFDKSGPRVEDAQTPLQREAADSDASPDDDAEAVHQKCPQTNQHAEGGGGRKGVGLQRTEGVLLDLHAEEGLQTEVVLDLGLCLHAFPVSS